jgi:serine/threonine protein kinase
MLRDEVLSSTLHFILSRFKRFHEDLARFYAAEIILAVNFVHKCGIVHREIKPQNVLLDKDGYCKLADFGMCKVGMFTRSKTSGVSGTKRYMDPEISRGDLKWSGGQLDVSCTKWCWESAAVRKFPSIVNDFQRT